MTDKPNFVHQCNHAGRAFTGNVVMMCYYWVNRKHPDVDREWCINIIRRHKNRNSRRYKLKYGRKA